jgi:nicotinamide riboside kinase
LERERIYSATGYLFVDTNPITTYMFAKEYHGFALPKLYEMARNAEKDYDLFFVCDTDIPYDDTWDRSGDVQRQIFQRKILADLHERKIPYIMLSGTLQQRIDRVDEILSRFSKFKGLGSLV